jgi:hypothetical protein
MKYLLMNYGSQEKWDSIPAEQWPAEIAKQDAFNRRYHASGELLAGYGLADAAAAKLVRRRDGVPEATTGTYLATPEYLATCYLLEVADEQRAYEIAADMPWADQVPTEVWPILHESALD